MARDEAKEVEQVWVLKHLRSVQTCEIVGILLLKQ